MTRRRRNLTRLAALPGQGEATVWLAALGEDIGAVLDEAGDLEDELVAHVLRTRSYRPTPADLEQALSEVRAAEGWQPPVSAAAHGCSRCGTGWVAIRTYRGDPADPIVREATTPCTACERGRAIAAGLERFGPVPRAEDVVADIERRAAEGRDPPGRQLLSVHVHRGPSGWEPPLPGRRSRR